MLEAILHCPCNTSQKSEKFGSCPLLTSFFSRFYLFFLPHLSLYGAPVISLLIHTSVLFWYILSSSVASAAWGFWETGKVFLPHWEWWFFCLISGWGEVKQELCGVFPSTFWTGETSPGWYRNSGVRKDGSLSLEICLVPELFIESESLRLEKTY